MNALSLSVRHTAAALVLAGALACGRSDSAATDSAAGSVNAQRVAADTAPETGSPPAAGGFVQVTPADAENTRLASELKLTNENFGRFVRATDSLAVLRARDPQARALFEQGSDTAGARPGAANVTTVERLEANPAVRAAITGTGMSVKDYFVAAIAIGQAERHIDKPELAPPTAVLPDNAEFLRTRQAELAALRSRAQGQAAPVQAQ